MNFVIGSAVVLAGLGLLLLFLMALLSPFEAMGWWAGWSKRDLESSTAAGLPADSPSAPLPEASHYIVYLTAIGGISAEDISSRERRYLALVQERLPEAKVISDVFPFSVTNNPLNGERALGWMWQKIHNSRMKRHATSFLSILIFVRNLFQVGVSADPRYGPINNVGVANEIIKSLVREGYPVGSGKPITVMGWSGGGQIAVGVARYLHRGLETPVYVVSIGGVLTDDASIEDVEHLCHLQGSKDFFPRIGDILYPGRWRIISYSAWNRAKRAGRITVFDPGPMVHTGRGDYFDHHATLPNGQTHVEKTAEITVDCIAHPEKYESQVAIGHEEAG